MAYVILPIQPIYPTEYICRASTMFIINCTPYPYLYVWPPLVPYIHLFLHLRLFLSILMWSETKLNRLCVIFKRIQKVPQQSGGSYSRKATRMKTGNQYRKIEIRLLLISYLLINQAIKVKETMNSSNYTLVTYLSDIEWKRMHCHFCMVLANLSF